jgi:hypothetical protein
MKSKRYGIIVLFISIVVLFVVLLYVFFLKRNNSTVQFVKIERGGTSIEASHTGSIVYKDAYGGETSWESTESAVHLIDSVKQVVKDHMNDASTTQYVLTLNTNQGSETVEGGNTSIDQAIGTIIQEQSNTQGDTSQTDPEQSGDDEPHDTPDDSYTNIFPTPTRRIRPTPTGNPTPTPDDCPFWRIAYCVWPTPTPIPREITISPTPTEAVYPNLIFDCTLSNSVVTKRTVISDTLCVSGE